jgi:hypothetical protein
VQTDRIIGPSAVDLIYATALLHMLKTKHPQRFEPRTLCYVILDDRKVIRTQC